MRPFSRTVCSNVQSRMVLFRLIFLTNHIITKIQFAPLNTINSSSSPISMHDVAMMDSLNSPTMNKLFYLQLCSRPLEQGEKLMEYPCPASSRRRFTSSRVQPLGDNSSSCSSTIKPTCWITW